MLLQKETSEDSPRQEEEALRVLIRKAAAGDEAAFSELVARYERLVYHLAWQSNPAEAEDIAQEVFVKIWRALPTFRFDCSPTTWICRITQNTCIDEARRAGVKRVVSLTKEEDGSDGETEIPDRTNAANPEDSALRGEARRIIRTGIASLREEYRVPLTLRDLDGRSYEEIAEILSLELGTVKSRINRGRAQLRRYLEDCGYF